MDEMEPQNTSRNTAELGTVRGLIFAMRGD
jgi:hypothetical protein